jgi:hypothetical protein
MTHNVVYFAKSIIGCWCPRDVAIVQLSLSYLNEEVNFILTGKVHSKVQSVINEFGYGVDKVSSIKECVYIPHFKGVLHIHIKTKH